MHVSQMGGITPARSAAIHAQVYGIRTAWHGPGDTSPVGHAANLHLDLWAPNFGIQEWCRFGNLVYEMFPGLPEVRGGYMYPSDKPGLGIDFNEELAAQYPPASIRSIPGPKPACLTAAPAAHSFVNFGPAGVEASWADRRKGACQNFTCE